MTINLTILSRRAKKYEALLSDKLEAHFQLIHVETESLSLTQCEQTECLLADPDFAAEVLDKCVNLKWIQSTWAGVEALTQCGKDDYILTGVKDVFGKRMREYVLGHLLEDARKISAFKALKEESNWSPQRISYLYGKTLGVMGLGNIGLEVAKAACAFDMNVVGYANSRKTSPYISACYVPGEEALFAQSLDYLIVLLPQTKDTDNKIDADFLTLLPERCLLMNAGRGNVIDELALCNALEQGEIRAAVLDVFKQEPLPQLHPFWACPNLLITQHTAAITNTNEVAEIFLRNAKLYTERQPLECVINLNKGY